MHCSGGPRVLMCPLSPQWGNTDKRWGSPWGGWGPHAGAGRTDPLWPHTGGSPKSPQRGVPTPRGHNGAHPIEGGAAAALHKCAEQKVCQWDRRAAWARRADGRTDGRGANRHHAAEPTAGRCHYITMASSGSGPRIGQRIFTVGGEQIPRRDNLIAGWDRLF